MKKNLKNKKQIDGKASEKDFSNARSLEDIFGVKESPFGVATASEYQDKLSEMNMADLQRECATHSLLPLDNRTLMEERLLKAFQRYKDSIAPRTPAKQINIKGNKSVQSLLDDVRPLSR
jgi:hypothetical protein